MFDRVVVPDENGARRVYSANEFMALPLPERVRYILSRNLEFYLGGSHVDRGAALRSLRG